MVGGIKKQSYTAFWIAGAIFVLFLAAGLAYIMLVRRYNTEDSMRFLNDSVSQRRAALNQQFIGDLQILKGIAASISEMDFADREKVYNILARVSDGNSFLRMGFADTAGLASMVDRNGAVYHNVDLSGKAFFAKALSGADSISPTFKEDIYEKTGEYVNYYAVPVYKGEQVAGVLVAANIDSTLRKIIAVPVFSGEGYYFVLDSIGKTVLPTADQALLPALGSSIFQVAKFPAGEREKLANILENGTGGNFELTYNGKEDLGLLQPLGINDWSVLGVVPRATIYAHYSRTSIGAAFIIMIAALIFLFHIFWLLKTVIRNHKALEYLAYTDLLTGARNYAKFLIDAELLMKDGDKGSYAIWSFDVKDFGRINELYGNDVGDEVLVKVAELLEEHAGDGIMCRVSADRFAGIMKYGRKKDLYCWPEGVFKDLSERRTVKNSLLRLSGAIGIYCADDTGDSLTIDNMANRASVAKKQAKELPGSNALFFTEDTGRIIQRELQLETTSRASLAAGHINFHLQPKVRIQGPLRIAGAEALARWDDPTYGRISPGYFIPLFERNGFITTLDREIFEQLCGWYGKWLAGGKLSAAYIDQRLAPGAA